MRRMREPQDAYEQVGQTSHGALVCVGLIWPIENYTAPANVCAAPPLAGGGCTWNDGQASDMTTLVADLPIPMCPMPRNSMRIFAVRVSVGVWPLVHL